MCVLVLLYPPSNMFSFLISTQEAAHLPPPRVLLNCITAGPAVSYGALWFIERFWWGYERAKDKVISPLPNRNTEFISLPSNRPSFFFNLILRCCTSHGHFIRHTRWLAEYITPWWSRGEKKCKGVKIHYTAALTHGAFIQRNSSWCLFNSKWPYLPSSITRIREKKRWERGSLRAHRRLCVPVHCWM